MKRGWFVADLPKPPDGEPPAAHYFAGQDPGANVAEEKSLCGHASGAAREWNVAQDVGRVLLCEDCKRAVRGEPSPEDGPR